MHSLIPLSLLFTVFHPLVNAVILPFKVRFDNDLSSLRRRDPIPIGNTGNAQYVSNITIGGTTLPVLLDTGSSDLWVHFGSSSPSSMKDTGKQVTLSYAVGKATGHVHTATVQLGNVTVEDQAFLNVVDTSTFTSNIHQQGYDGLLGLGPNSGSVIRKKVDDKSANSYLQRLFAQSKATSNYITFLLDRKHDANSMTGQFTINEVIPTLSNVTTMPAMDVDKVNRLLKADQHWQLLTDTDVGIIGPDGNPIKVDSIVPSAPKGQFVAVIDSGFTFSQVPREVSDAIYGRVRGAYYDTKNEWWLVPCGQYLNISFSFGGRAYPIHPLDAVDDNFGKIDNTGKKVCIGAFQPITSAFSMFGHYDMILGMSFLRNAYTLLDFGTWIEGGNDKEHPFIQMLPTTNVDVAQSTFVQVRLGGNDTVSDPRWSLLSSSEMQHSPVSEEEKKKRYQAMVLSRWPYIFAGCFVLLLIIIGCCIWRCCKRRRAGKAGKAKGMGKFGDVFSKDTLRHKSLALSSAKRQSYVPLEAASTTNVQASYPQLQIPRPAHDPRQPGPQSQRQHDDRDSNYSQHDLPPYTEVGYPQRY